MPPRRRGVEILDDPATDPELRARSLHDVARSNALFGGARAVLAELAVALRGRSGEVSLLDVGTGLGDIPARARALAARRGVRLVTFGVDAVPCLAAASRDRGVIAAGGDALALPFGDGSVDVVSCSQVLHHFTEDEGRRLVRELDRVARERVIISDIRRTRLAAAGIWLASFPLRFHPVSRHDGVVSVMRGFTTNELETLVRSAVGRRPAVVRRAGFRVTASWRPTRNLTR